MAITEAKARVRFCSRCFNVADDELCLICADPRRDAGVLCVVEESRDIVAIERTGEFKGRYHVLLGAISPLEGIGPEQLKVRELLIRLEPEAIQEVIVCTNPNTEGEVTAMYLARTLKPLGLTVTRIASGLPVGGDLEYADELTLGPGPGRPPDPRRLNRCRAPIGTAAEKIHRGRRLASLRADNGRRRPSTLRRDYGNDGPVSTPGPWQFGVKHDDDRRSFGHPG